MASICTYREVEVRVEACQTRRRYHHWVKPRRERDEFRSGLVLPLRPIHGNGRFLPKISLSPVTGASSYPRRIGQSMGVASLAHEWDRHTSIFHNRFLGFSRLALCARRSSREQGLQNCPMSLCSSARVRSSGEQGLRNHYLLSRSSARVKTDDKVFGECSSRLLAPIYTSTESGDVVPAPSRREIDCTETVPGQRHRLHCKHLPATNLIHDFKQRTISSYRLMRTVLVVPPAALVSPQGIISVQFWLSCWVVCLAYLYIRVYLL